MVLSRKVYGFSVGFYTSEGLLVTMEPSYAGFSYMIHSWLLGE
jgi:hypothetical protein